MRYALGVLFRRELALTWGGGGGPLLACAFLACLTAIAPLAAGGEKQQTSPRASNTHTSFSRPDATACVVILAAPAGIRHTEQYVACSGTFPIPCASTAAELV